jgi:hypothetical protein
MNLRRASSSDRLSSALSLANVSRTLELGGSFDKALWSRFRMTPGFAGLVCVRPSASTEWEREGAAVLVIESGSSGVGGKMGADNRVETRFEEEGSSKGRDLLDGTLEAGMFERLDEVDEIECSNVQTGWLMLLAAVLPCNFRAISQWDMMRQLRDASTRCYIQLRS